MHACLDLVWLLATVACPKVPSAQVVSFKAVPGGIVGQVEGRACYARCHHIRSFVAVAGHAQAPKVPAPSRLLPRTECCRAQGRRLACWPGVEGRYLEGRHSRSGLLR